MFFKGFSSKQAQQQDDQATGKLKAIDRALAVIEFDIDGTICTANQNFLSVMGYTLNEIVGQHHRIFVAPAEAGSASYSQFWQELRSGQFKSSQYKRIGKGGKEVWIQATYNPIMDTNGRPVGVVKFATDITEQKLAATDAAGQIEAISRSQAVIEFDMTGKILNANDSFLNVMGYSLEEIRGRHHRMFVERDHAASQDYREFWSALERGEFQAAQYKRLGKNGKEVWIQATYNPIFGEDGKPVKVVKFATDITERRQAINLLRTSLQRLAGGDLRVAITQEFPGELDELRAALNQTVDQLKNLVEQIQTATNEVDNAASEISSGTIDLSSRTEQAASSLEETAASTEEMAATVKQNADNAKNASRLAGDANKTADKGGKVVKHAVAAMAGIEEQARRITDIISVIDEIAFQTNLLALNASVEAARAGEAGKGFAVVAQEVRQLAQRSAQAASDIKKLIQDSNGQVKNGVQLVNQAGEALTEIVASISKVAGIVEEISSATQEQASGIQEINAAVTNMDEMTQQNSALVEESSAAARALSDQAGKLAELMAFFKLGGAKTRNRPQPKPSRKAHAKPATRLSVAAAGNDDGWNEF